jgi:hypothetical protein
VDKSRHVPCIASAEEFDVRNRDTLALPDRSIFDDPAGAGYTRLRLAIIVPIPYDGLRILWAVR